MNEKKLALASRLMKDRETPIGEVCEAVGVSRATLYRHLKPDGSLRDGAVGYSAEQTKYTGGAVQ